MITKEQAQNAVEIIIQYCKTQQCCDDCVICDLWCRKASNGEYRKDKTYKDGINEAWELLNKLCKEPLKIKEIYNKNSITDIIFAYPASVALQMYKEWEKKHIKAGDIVIDLDGREKIVMEIDFANNAYIFDRKGITKIRTEHLKKTEKENVLSKINSLFETLGENKYV